MKKTPPPPGAKHRSKKPASDEPIPPTIPSPRAELGATGPTAPATGTASPEATPRAASNVVHLHGRKPKPKVPAPPPIAPKPPWENPRLSWKKMGHKASHHEGRVMVSLCHDDGREAFLVAMEYPDAIDFARSILSVAQQALVWRALGQVLGDESSWTMAQKDFAVRAAIAVSRHYETEGISSDSIWRESRPSVVLGHLWAMLTGKESACKLLEDISNPLTVAQIAKVWHVTQEYVSKAIRTYLFLRRT